MSDQHAWKNISICMPFCGIAAAGAGIIALLGWMLDVPSLASLGAGLIPMAPSTALLFILYGVAVFLRSAHPDNRAISRAALTIHAAGAVLALLLLVLSCNGTHLEAERLGLSAFGKVGGQPVGYMSPLTAFCFILASLSYLAAISSANHPLRATVARLLAWFLISLSVILMIAYLYGAPLLYGGPFIPPAATTSGAFLFLAMALLSLSGSRDARTSFFHAASPLTSWRIAALLALLSTGIVAAGFFFQKNFEERYRSEVESQLTAIVDLKVRELQRYRKELLADATVYFNNPVFVGLARRFLERQGDVTARNAVRSRLERILAHDQYVRVALVDAGCVERLSVPGSRSTPRRTSVKGVSEALRNRKALLRDFYRDEFDGKVYLSVLTPLYDEETGNRPIGAVQIVVDPDKYLYPYIREWPTASRTAETLLVRRDGDDVLFLNELRFRRDTALSLRFSLGKHGNQTAVQAVLGKNGVIEGSDYRGEPVIACVRPVPGSPWFLVARMDLMEVYAPVRERLWVMVVLVAGLLIGAGGGIGSIWRRQATLHFREKMAAAEVLEQKNTELERFTYTISHDLKSPLVTIKTFLGYLEQDLQNSDTGRVEQDMLYIRTAADKMGRLLDELLEMSRIGRLVNAPERIPIRELLDEALDMVAGGIAEKGIEVHLDDVPVTLYGDRSRLVEIWENLLENAVKYMGNQSEPRIEIGVEPRGRETVYFVRDNGMGIDPLFREKVFGLFEKLDPNSEGTGIGLALVKRIVEMYRGSIRVESEGVGHGACFRFTLPGAFADQKEGAST